MLLACGAGASAAEPVQGTLAVSWDTGQKPQSKLWYDLGTWWAALPQEKGVFLCRYAEGKLEPQAAPGALKGTTLDCECDVVLSKDTLLVLAFHRAGQESTLHAFKFTDGAYKEQAAYPVTLSHPAGVTTMTVDVDSTGCLWLAYVHPTDGVVAQSFQPGKPEAGFSKPVTLAAGVPKGNTSGIVAFKGHVGVMWSNGKAEEFGFRAHQDGKPADQWEPAEVVAAGKGVVNDHLNLAADTDGNVWAVTKAATGVGLSAVQLTLHRRNAEGKWDKHYPVLTGELVEGKNIARTRPVVVLDADKPVAYVMYSDKVNVSSIYLRRVSLTDGKAGEEIKVLSAGYALNNVTDCKAMVSAKTGLLVLAGAADAKAGPACFRLFERSVP